MSTKKQAGELSITLNTTFDGMALHDITGIGEERCKELDKVVFDAGLKASSVSEEDTRVDVRKVYMEASKECVTNEELFFLGCRFQAFMDFCKRSDIKDEARKMMDDIINDIMNLGKDLEEN